MTRFTLIKTDDAYALNDDLSAQHALRIDFMSPQLQYRRLHGGKKELLFKAVKAKAGLKVWDCTAGLGTDSFLLAAKGCQVTLFERSRILALLLEQAIAKALDSNELKEIVTRMRLIKADAIDYLGRESLNKDIPSPDVILIDPMFPTRQKRAQVKGDMQILQRFLGKDEDASALLARALQSACPRVVVKRPATGADIEGYTPTHSFSAKANRFDIFLN